MAETTKIPKPTQGCDDLIRAVLNDVELRGRGGLVLKRFDITASEVVLTYEDA